MALTKSNKLGEDIYKKEVFYIDTKSLTDSLYSDAPEFKSSLSRDLSRKLVDDLDSFLTEEDSEKTKSKRRKPSPVNGKILSNPKFRKPVISFFSDKAKVLKEEIEKINLDMEIRKKIHRTVLDDICKGVKEIRRLLQEISLYSPGTKHSIDIRRLDLEREIMSLGKEKRMTKLSLWKDLVFLRRELRETIFEYQALQRMSELVENGGNKNDVAG